VEIPKITNKQLGNKKITLLTGTNYASVAVKQVQNGNDQL